MKIALRILLRPGFAAAFGKLCAEPFTPAVRFRLAQTNRAIEDALVHHAEVHNALVKQFSADGKGNAVDVADVPKLSGFSRAMQELGGQEITLPLEPVELPSDTRLDANEMAELLELIREK